MKNISKLLILIVLLLLVLNETWARRGKGNRRRKMQKQNSKVLFHTNPKRAEYYNNADVSVPYSLLKQIMDYFQGAIIIRASHFDYEFYLGHKILFICVAKGNPLPTITWFKDGIELDNKINSYLHINEWKISEGNETQIKSKLEIDPARQMDSGTYECMANNKYAVDRKNFKADF